MEVTSFPQLRWASLSKGAIGKRKDCVSGARPQATIVFYGNESDTGFGGHSRPSEDRIVLPFLPHGHAFSGKRLAGLLQPRRPSLLGLLRAVYRHGRLDIIENVAYRSVEDISTDSSGLPSPADHLDLDTMSRLYLESGSWDKEADQASHAPSSHGKHSMRGPAQGSEMHTTERWEERARSNSAASTNGGSSPVRPLERDQLQSNQLLPNEQLATDMYKSGGGRSSPSAPILDSQNFRRESLPRHPAGESGSGHTSAGDSRRVRPAAKLWHETIEGFDVGPTDSRKRGMDGEGLREVRSSQHSPEDDFRPESSWAETAHAKGAQMRPSRLEQGLRNLEVTEQKPASRMRGGQRKAASVRLRQPSNDMQSRPSSARVHQEEPWDFTAEAPLRERGEGGPKRREGEEEAERRGEDSGDQAQGLVFGKAGLIAIVGLILRWARQLAQVLASKAAKLLPESIPRGAVEPVVNGALVLTGVWLCKAALEVVLTLGTVLCCLCIATRVLWAAAASRRNVGPREGTTSFKVRSQDDWQEMQERGRTPPSGAHTRESLSAKVLRNTGKVPRESVAGRYTTGGGFKKKGGLSVSEFVRGGVDIVAEKARRLVTGFVGSDVDVLRMFDLASEDRPKGGSPNQIPRNKRKLEPELKDRWF